MEITVSTEQGRVPVTVFRLNGELTSGEALEAQARQAYENGNHNILLDLSGVPYMSSAGLRALHAVFKLLRSDDPKESDQAMKKGIVAGTFTSPHLKLYNPTSHVLEVLRTAGYDMFLEIHRDYKKAISSF